MLIIINTRETRQQEAWPEPTTEGELPLGWAVTQYRKFPGKKGKVMGDVAMLLIFI